MKRLALPLLTVFLAGCLTPALEGEPGPPTSADDAVAWAVLAEPLDLVAPTFQRLAPIAQGLPTVSSRGEPSIAAGSDGSLFVAFPGCDRLANPPLVGASACPHGPVFKSADRGAQWTRLNRPDGKLDPEAPNANGDNDVAVDQAGYVYSSDLGGGGIQTFASYDRGATWKYIGNVVESNRTTQARFSADRNWMAAGKEGNLIVAWMGAGPNASRVIAVNTTFDAGRTWEGAQYGHERIGWLGTVQFHPDLQRAYVPFTRPFGTADPTETQEFELWVMMSQDAGRTWQEHPTGQRVTRSAQGGHWSGVLMAPAFDVTGDGHLVYAWSEEVLDPAGIDAIGSRVRVITSGDDGASWSTPLLLSESPNAIMPWVSGGGGDRFSVAYYAGSMQGDNDFVPGVWSLEAVIVDGASKDAPKVVRTVVDPRVHVGQICTRGTQCQGSDRTFLDFFETDLLPDGFLAITYAGEDPMNARQIEIRFAVQDGGSPLFVPLA
jgi:hypothetical protein